jgi:hypothetical protein
MASDWHDRIMMVIPSINGGHLLERMLPTLRPAHPLSRIRERDDRGWPVSGAPRQAARRAPRPGRHRRSAAAPAEDTVAVLPQEPEAAIPVSVEPNRRVHPPRSTVQPVTAVGPRRYCVGLA